MLTFTANLLFDPSLPFYGRAQIELGLSMRVAMGLIFEDARDVHAFVNHKINAARCEIGNFLFKLK